MRISNWQQKYLYIYQYHTSTVLINLKQLSQIWLINCFEGCQHALLSKNIKIAQIKKIIIMHSDPGSINGLLGLLSSISLNTEGSRIDVYGPQSLHKYIFWGRKYSKTHFRQRLYFYDVSCGAILERLSLCINPYIRFGKNLCDYYELLNSEQTGMFDCNNAKSYNVPFGPLYGRFKKGQNFILPDGFILYSQHFIRGYYLEHKVVLINCRPKKCHINVINNISYNIIISL